MKKVNWLLIIFVISLGLRLYFAFQSPYFSYGDSYLDLRRVEYTAATGLPLFQDTLSYSGMSVIYLPFFHYVIALFANFMNLVIAAKVLPNIFASLVVFVVYGIIKHITQDEKASLIGAFTSAFIPVFVSETFNSVSVYSLAIPLIFACLLFLMKTKDTEYYLLLFFILAFTSSSILIMIFALLIYLGLLKMASLREDNRVFELVTFTGIFAVWFNLLIYRKGLLSLGHNLIWRNIPKVININYFANFNLLDAILKIGVLPFVLGLFIIYRQIFRQKNKDTYMIMSFCLGTLLLSWMRLIDLSIGLSLLGISMTILFGIFLHSMYRYIGKTRFSEYSKIATISALCLIVVTSIIPTLIYTAAALENVPSDDLVNNLIWVRDNTPENSIVLGSLQNGHLVSSIAKRKNVLDENFLYVKNPSTYVEDTNAIFATSYQTDGVKLLEKYDVDYVILENETLTYLNNQCFEKKTNMVYRTKCKIE